MVSKGFITDFGSVPSLSKSLVDDDDPDLLFASLPHDFLYKHRGWFTGCRLSRAQADEVLWEAMLAVGAPRFKAWLIYNAVRIGGPRW